MLFQEHAGKHGPSSRASRGPVTEHGARRSRPGLRAASCRPAPRRLPGCLRGDTDRSAASRAASSPAGTPRPGDSPPTRPRGEEQSRAGAPAGPAAATRPSSPRPWQPPAPRPDPRPSRPSSRRHRWAPSHLRQRRQQRTDRYAAPPTPPYLSGARRERRVRLASPPLRPHRPPAGAKARPASLPPSRQPGACGPALPALTACSAPRLQLCPALKAALRCPKPCRRLGRLVGMLLWAWAHAAEDV